MRLTEYTTIDEILDDLVPVFLNHNGLIPMDWTPARKNVLFSLTDDFTNRLMQLAANLSEKDIEEIYVSPSHYVKAAHKFQNACKNNICDKKVVLSTYMTLCNAAVAGWRMQVKAIQGKLPSMRFLKCTPDVQEQIAYFNSLARAFSEAIYCDDHTIGGDICGPINTDEGILIAREYVRIRPTELFGILDSFRIKSIITYCIYDDISIKVDLIGNLTQCNNMVTSLRKYYIEVIDDNNETHIVNENELQPLIQYLETWLKKVVVHYKNLSEQKKYELLFDCEFYAFKPLMEHYNMAWQPQSYELRDISHSAPRGMELRKKLSMLTEQEEIIQCTKQILDPRL